jgi:hypothetical protein
MTKETSLVMKLEYIYEIVNLETFYSINCYPRRNELTLQGEISISAVKVAKHFNVPLSYNEDTGNMVGENEDGSLRIVLTD